MWTARRDARFESRDVRSALRAQRRPVDAGKERVRLDLFCGCVAEPPFAVAEQRPHLKTCGVWDVRCVWRPVGQASGIRELSSHEVLGLGRQCGLGWELEGLLVAQDLAARHQRVVAVEGRVSHEHLEHDDAERPPVAVLVVARGRAA